MTALNGWIALALYLIGLGLAFGFRAVVHLRRNGDTGFRLKAGTAGSAQWWGKLLFAVALLLGLAGPVTQIVGIGRLTIPGGTIVEGIGLVLALLGMRTLLRAQREMGASWRVGVDPEEHTEMVTDGTFAMVRNPVFSGMAVSSVGLFLLAPTIASLTATVVLLVAIQVQVRAVEEPYLRAAHGDAYRDYAARVGRFVPRMGRTFRQPPR